jgi:uncharacterized membrane protein YjjP (DUF1212 family)
LRGCSRGVRILIVASLALVFVEVLTAAGSGHHGSPVGPNGSAAEWSYRQPDDQEDQPDGSAPTTSERQEPATDGASRGEDTPAGAPQVEGTPDTDPPTRETPTGEVPTTMPGASQPSTTGQPTSTAPTSAPPTTTEPGAEESNPEEEPGRGGAGANGDPDRDEVPGRDDAGADKDNDEGEGEGEGEGSSRTSRPAQVRSSNVPIGSILLAVLVLIVIGVATRVILRRQPGGRISDTDEAPEHLRPATTPPPEDETAAQLNVRTLDLLLELGRVLIRSEVAVSMVASTLERVANRYGIDNLGTIVFPNSLVLSIPNENSVHTEAAAAETAPLRLDQMDDVTNLIQRVTRTSMTVDEARGELERIQQSDPQFTPKVRVGGYILATIGLVLLLHGTWKELLVGGALGALIGSVFVMTRGITASWYVSFQPLVAALTASIGVFTAVHFISDFRVIPALIAPLVMLMQGTKLTMGVIELLTGDLVAGTSRVASGIMQLVLLGFGIVAGAQLVGVEGSGLSTGEASSIVGTIAPWVGVAVFGIGIIWYNGGLRSSRWWLLGMLYLAYAAQVLGALFFGGALSSFFGAVALTPFAALATRHSSAPSPLVIFLPAFRILVPGSLGLQGVTMLLGPLGSNGLTTLATTLTSMIGISLGVLLGLSFVERDPDRAWFGDVSAANDVPAEETATPAEPT